VARRRDTGALPNLVVIGAMKAGTTSLHRYLGRHPDVAMSERKELDLFVRPDWRERLAWYRAHFPAEAPWRGESSPNYAKRRRFPDVPARIAEALPDVRIVYILRDPVERIVSHYVHLVAARKESRPLEEALDELDHNPLVDPSLYHAQLGAYLAHFPSSRIHLTSLEELAASPRATMAALFRFLGVDPTFDSPDFARVHHPSHRKRRATPLGRVALRSLGAWRVNRVRRRAKVVDRVLRAGPVERPVLADGLRHRLEDRLREDVRDLRRLTGRPFEAWSL
jgi:hypothetical protein